MASLAHPQSRHLPAPKQPATTGLRSLAERRVSDDADWTGPLAHGTGVVELTSAANAVVHRSRVFRRTLIGADIISAGLALIVTAEVLGDDRLRLRAIMALPLVVLVSKVIGLYDRDEVLLEKRTIDEAPALFQLTTLLALLAWLGEDQLVKGEFGRLQIVGVWLCLTVAVIAGRIVARAVARRATDAERIIVVGNPAGCERVRSKITGNPHVSACVVAELPHRPRRENEAAWTPEMLAEVVSGHAIDRMIVAPWSNETEAVVDLVRVAKGIGLNVSILPGLFEAVGSHVQFDELDGMTVLAIPRFELTRSSRAVKRAMDFAGAALGLALVAPLFGLIALAVRLESDGPVFFGQTRVGRGGGRFQILKFRTMVENAEALKQDLLHLNEQDGGLFKIAADPRVTRVGRFLRKTSLDELPQLLNVLRGEMSLVGPRPLVVDEDDLVKGWSRRRLHLTPGMTGPWQILGGGRVPLQEMVKIDYLYVTGWSLWNDVKILLRTVGYVVARQSV
jgi:exopolysaccharide biosynthesis polyprenyl glycosylphosphotransferase